MRAAVSPTPPVVAVTKPKQETLKRELVLNGELRPYQMADLHAKVAGYLREIHVDAGSVVRAGQQIAVLEIPEMDAEIAQATADRERTEAELARSKAEWDRAQANTVLAKASIERLVQASKSEPGIVAQQEIDEAKARLAAADAQAAAAKAAIEVERQRLASAQATVRRAQTMADYRSITAPFSGVVVKRFADKGAMIQSGTASQTQTLPLVRIAEIARLRLAFAVPESAVPMVHAGDTVEVRITSLNRKFQARVSRLTRDVASASRTMEAEIDVANPDGSMTPGMYADVVLSLQREVRGLTLPITAITNSGGNRTVWVVNSDGALEERAIKTGIETASSLEVLSGVSLDDDVVISNRSLLRAGQKVQARETAD